MKLGKEDMELIKIFDWLRENPAIEEDCFHIANERKCSVIQGNILKRKGVKSGVADIFVAIPSQGYHGLWVELKTGKNKATPNQKLFLARMTARGYMAICAWDFEGGSNIILEYLKIPDWRTKNNHVLRGTHVANCN